MAEHRVGDVLDLPSLGRQLDAAVDLGCFHTLSDADRPLSAGSLAAALRPGGRYLLLGFSTRTPGAQWPRRLTPADIHDTCAAGWRVLTPAEVRLHASAGGGGAEGHHRR